MGGSEHFWELNKTTIEYGFVLRAGGTQKNSDLLGLFTYAKIWLMLMFMLKYYKRKTLFHD
jgi:hypothetical protein